MCIEVRAATAQHDRSTWAWFKPTKGKARRRQRRAKPSTSEWLTQEDVMAELNLSRQTLHRYRKHPDYAHLNFPKPVLFGQRQLRWNRADIRAWAASRQRAN